MSVFKDLVPAWLALDTLHSVVGRPDVTAADLRLRGTWAARREIRRTQVLDHAALMGRFTSVAVGEPA